MTSIAPADFGFLQAWLHRHAGMVVEAGKEYLLETRLQPLAAKEGFKGLDALVASLRSAPAHSPLQRKVVEAMTIHETSFFRDLAPFDALTKAVLPELIQRRAHERSLTIWCAAASAGQEPYSIAMLIRDRFPQLAAWRLRIVATDISTAILEKAGSGLYTQAEMNRGLPAMLMVKYFRRAGMQWQINDEIRKLVEFRQLNLTESLSSIPASDVVFLRNVLIYFDLPTRRKIFGELRRVLKPDGTLFLGSAETTIHVDEGFEPAWLDKAVCFRLKSAA